MFFRNRKETAREILASAKFGLNKLYALLVLGLVFAQNAAAQASSLILPADTETKLTGIINDNFGTIIAVVVVMVAAGLLIKLLCKAG